MSELGTISVAPEVEETGSVPPETRLFRHIILNAVLDAVHGSGIRVSEDQRVRSEAFYWFTDAGPDFHFICECAGLHPQIVQRCALRYIEAASARPPARRRPTLNHISVLERRAA